MFPSLFLWMQPAQQQGLRIPSISSVQTLSTLCSLVSGFFASSTQQIHSLRDKGVMSSHAFRAAGKAIRFLRRSSGILCTTPPGISFLLIFILWACPLFISSDFTLFYYLYLSIFLPDVSFICLMFLEDYSRRRDLIIVFSFSISCAFLSLTA